MHTVIKCTEILHSVVVLVVDPNDLAPSLIQAL